MSLFVFVKCIVYIHTLFTKKEMFAFDRLFKENRLSMKDNLLTHYDRVLNKTLRTKIVIVRDKDILDIVKIGIVQIFRENKISF
jgi:hypothetical protein